MLKMNKMNPTNHKKNIWPTGCVYETDQCKSLQVK